jgi:hypothetical protein
LAVRAAGAKIRKRLIKKIQPLVKQAAAGIGGHVLWIEADRLAVIRKGTVKILFLLKGFASLKI